MRIEGSANLPVRYHAGATTRASHDGQPVLELVPVEAHLGDTGYRPFDRHAQTQSTHRAGTWQAPRFSTGAPVRVEAAGGVLADHADPRGNPTDAGRYRAGFAASAYRETLDRSTRIASSAIQGVIRV